MDMMMMMKTNTELCHNQIFNVSESHICYIMAVTGRLFISRKNFQTYMENNISL
jgi:hypothetical protein